MLAAENWCVKVDDKIYGPYTTPQMRKFAQQGRLASWSLISPAGSQTWREADKESAFAPFLNDAKDRPAVKAFGKRDTDCFQAPSKDALANASARRRARPDDVGVANFVVIFDVVSGAASRVEAAVFGLGPALRLADNVWSVACELTAVGVRNAIAPYLSGRESIFVIDTTRGRTSWQNYGPEAHAHISAAYMTPKPAKGANAH